MAKARRAGTLPRTDYWQKRVRSPGFKKRLTALIAGEMRALSAARIGDVVDHRAVRAIIADGAAHLVNREALAEVVIEINRRFETRLQTRSGSLADLLGAHLVGEIDAILSEDVALAQAEDFIAGIMEQDFIRELFTDIIFTSIVSFNRKVNPLFGSLTARVLEQQIRSFIDLFMPMLIRQATAFAIDRRNQRVVLDFTRTIVRQLLEAPLRNLAGTLSAAQRRRVEAMIRSAARNTRLDATIRQATLAAWDDVFQAIRERTVGELLRLESHAASIAAQAVALLLPALRRDPVLRFLADEMAPAAKAKE